MKHFYFLIILFSASAVFAQKNSRIDSLMLCLKKGNDREQFNTLSILSDEFSKNDLDRALYFANQSLKKARSCKNDTLTAMAYNTIANTFQYKSELDSALIFHKKSLYVRRKLNDSLGIADSYNNLGITYDAKGQFHEALENYFRALSFYDRKTDLGRLAMTYTNIGIVYKIQKEYKKALDYYRRANNLYIKADDPFGITVSSGNLGSILIDFGRYNESLKYSGIAREGYQKLGYDRYIAFPLSNIAVVYDSLHNFEAANRNYVESIGLHEKYQNWYEVANISNAYANCLIKQHKYLESIQFSQKGKNFAQKAKAYFLEVCAYRNLSKANAGTGNFAEAYLYSDLYATGRDSLFVNEKTKAILELETKYETDKKEKLLLLQKSEARQRNILLIILFILVISAVLIGYLIYRQQKLRNRQQEQEFHLKSAISQIETQNKLQEQRLSISRDLHDNIGAQLTFIISSVDNIKYAFDLKNKKLDSKLESISNFTKSTIVELRDTIWAMNSNEISFDDLRLRIFNLIEKAKIAKEDIGFKFNIDEGTGSRKFSSIKGINIYRTIQEAVNNSIKYSEASVIAIDVKTEGEEIRVTISDNGKGFDPDTVEAGNGLQNMQKRIKEIGAAFSIESSAGTGTTINITLTR